MKVFVDTNIFIDILLGREPFVKDAAMVYKLCENNLIDGYIAPITINNIYYICRKAKELEKIKTYLADISTAFTVASLGSQTVQKANKLQMSDHEDALQYAMALQNGCEYLVTRNVKDFKNMSHIKVLTPEAFLLTF